MRNLFVALAGNPSPGICLNSDCSHQDKLVNPAHKIATTVPLDDHSCPALLQSCCCNHAPRTKHTSHLLAKGTII